MTKFKPLNIEIELDPNFTISPEHQMVKEIVETSPRKMFLEKHIMQFLPLVNLMFDYGRGKFVQTTVTDENTIGMSEVLMVAAELLGEANEPTSS
jgi:hypothetical protein